MAGVVADTDSGGGGRDWLWIATRTEEPHIHPPGLL